jgi:hypothetical protein
VDPNTTVAAVPYDDGYATKIPDAVLAELRALREAYVSMDKQSFGFSWRNKIWLGRPSKISVHLLFWMFGNPIQDLSWLHRQRAEPGWLLLCFPVKHIDRDRILGTIPTQVRTATLHAITGLGVF